MSRFFTARILLSFAILTGAIAVVVAATFAFLSDTETSTANFLEAGDIDLKIDNTSYYNGAQSPTTTWDLDDLDTHLFFNFQDLKPGDWGEDTISIHVNTNDAWACFNSTLTSDDDVSSNEPELLVDVPEDNNDDFDGELGSNIDFLLWVDDGDNVLEQGESDNNIIAFGKANSVLQNMSESLADSVSGLVVDDGQPLSGGQTYYIAKAWCFGNMTLAPLPEGQGVNPTVDGGILCDGSGFDNSTQTDKLTADISFTTVQFRNNPDFVCFEEPQFACGEESDPIYAVAFSENNQGLRKNGTAILPDRTDPNVALGVPQSAGIANDAPVVAGSFFSLGFPHANNLNTPGSIVFDMGETFYPNNGGDDIMVYEVTGGTYPVETVKVEAKLEIGDSWTDLGTINRDGGVEMSPLTSARYIRLTEASNIAPFEATADGYDLDAVKALCTPGNQIDPGGQ